MRLTVPIQLPPDAAHRPRLLAEQGSGQIPLTGVRQHHHDQLAGIFRPPGHFQRGKERRAAGDTGENPLFAGKATGSGKRILVPDPDNLVDDPGIENVGDEARADPLDFEIVGVRDSWGQACILAILIKSDVFQLSLLPFHSRKNNYLYHNPS